MWYHALNDVQGPLKVLALVGVPESSQSASSGNQCLFWLSYEVSLVCVYTDRYIHICKYS